VPTNDSSDTAKKGSLAPLHLRLHDKNGSIIASILNAMGRKIHRRHCSPRVGMFLCD
jgi:hypothetical protein